MGSTETDPSTIVYPLLPLRDVVVYPAYGGSPVRR